MAGAGGVSALTNNLEISRLLTGSKFSIMN